MPPQASLLGAGGFPSPGRLACPTSPPAQLSAPAAAALPSPVKSSSKSHSHTLGELDTSRPLKVSPKEPGREPLPAAGSRCSQPLKQLCTRCPPAHLGGSEGQDARSRLVSSQ